MHRACLLPVWLLPVGEDTIQMHGRAIIVRERELKYNDEEI